MCAFHFLQSPWQWLWNSTSGVAGNDRLLSMSMVKELLFADSSEKLLAAKQRIDSNVKVQQNIKVSKQVAVLLGKA